MSRNPESLRPFFYPRAISVIGASSDTVKLGGRAFRNLKEYGYKGKLYPVNNSRDEVQGVPTVPSIAELPDEVDLALVLVPAVSVVEALEAYAARGVPAAVVFSSGFAEIGEAGQQAQRRITEIAETTGMRIVGPNCMGVMNVRDTMFGTFSSSFDSGIVKGGRISLVSQSGAFGAHGIILARDRGLGLGLWITTGNECDVDVADALAYIAQDEGTDVILAYMEGCRSKERLVEGLELARANHKPVVVLKVGRTDVGAVAASSHTASLVGSDAVFDAIFKQYGVHRAETIEELFDIGYACTARHFPPGKNLGLVTISGGVGVIMADAASKAGLEVPPLSDEAQRILKELIPFAAVRNPVDFTAMALSDTSLVQKNLEVMLSVGGCDAVVLFLGAVGLNPVLMPKLIAAMQEIRKRFPDGLIMLAMNARKDFTEQLEQAGYLLIEDPTRAIRAVSALMGFARAFEARDSNHGPPALPAGAAEFPKVAVSEFEAKRIVGSAGIPVVEERLAGSAGEAVAAAEALGYPVVLKIASPDIQHKSEMGGVLLHLDGAEAVGAGYATLMERAATHHPHAKIEGVLVAPMVTDGVETILGVSRDPVFGPVVMFGLGGIFVEVLKDVTLRVAPFGVEEAHAMIREVKGYPLLEGVRGQPPADVEALAQALAHLSVFAAAHGDELESLDINPFIVRPAGKGALAVDALIVPRTE